MPHISEDSGPRRYGLQCGLYHCREPGHTSPHHTWTDSVTPTPTPALLSLPLPQGSPSSPPSCTSKSMMSCGTLPPQGTSLCRYTSQDGLATWQCPKKLNLELPHGPAIPHTQKNLKEIYTPMFTAALFTTAKKWKKPKCPSTNEWLNKTYIQTHLKRKAIPTHAPTGINC